MSAAPSALAGRRRPSVRVGIVTLAAAALTAGQALLPGAAVGPLPTIPTAQAAGQPHGPWYVSALRLDEAHTISTGAGVVVAVIDGGVDATHPALAGQVLPGFGLGADAAPDGRRDDDSGGHGTSMAGLIAARPVGQDGRSTGFLGVAPDAKILPISTGAEADSSEVAQAIRLATDHGAKVISISLGSLGTSDPAERSAVRYAVDHDVIVVAAAGNVDDPADADPLAHAINSPANIPGVIAVTGSNPRGEFWEGSARGPLAALAAPAPSVRAPVPVALSRVGASAADGTSNSTAIVSGVAALLWAKHPELNAPSVIELMLRTADDKGSPGRDQEFGYGIVNPVAALRAQPALVAANPLLDASPALVPGPLEEDEDALLRADAPAGTSTAPPGSPTAAPTAAQATGESGPGALAWVGGLAASVLLGIGLGVGAFALWSRIRRRSGSGAASNSSAAPLTPPPTPPPYRSH